MNSLKYIKIASVAILASASAVHSQTTVDDSISMGEVFTAVNPGGGLYILGSPYDWTETFTAEGTTFEAVFTLVGDYNNGNDSIRLANGSGSIAFGSNPGFQNLVDISLKSVTATGGDLTGVANFTGFTTVTFSDFTMADGDSATVAGTTLTTDQSTYTIPSPVTFLSFADVSNTTYYISDFGYRFTVEPSAIPEPSSAALLLGFVAGCFTLCRRRRRA